MPFPYQSSRMDYETPAHIFDSLDSFYGFTLDVCATPENAKCEKYFTIEDNGLVQDWRGDVCWMNPPYGRDVGKWVKKAYETAQLGGLVVGLIFARTDTRWWHDYVWYANAPRPGVDVSFLKGRVRFELDGVAQGPAPAPSVVIVWRPVR